MKLKEFLKWFGLGILCGLIGLSISLRIFG